jgi:hypothetical protein
MSEGTERNHDKLQSGAPVTGWKFETGSARVHKVTVAAKYSALDLRKQSLPAEPSNWFLSQNNLEI